MNGAVIYEAGALGHRYFHGGLIGQVIEHAI